MKAERTIVIKENENIEEIEQYEIYKNFNLYS